MAHVSHMVCIAYRHKRRSSGCWVEGSDRLLSGAWYLHSSLDFNTEGNGNLGPGRVDDPSVENEEACKLRCCSPGSDSFSFQVGHNPHSFRGNRRETQ